MMRNIQEIFDVVIDRGFYSNVPIYNWASWYMCEAVYFAQVTGHITGAERRMAVDAINEYLQAYVFLRAALSCSDLPCGYEDRLAIYKDWANRPQLTHDLQD